MKIAVVDLEIVRLLSQPTEILLEVEEGHVSQCSIAGDANVRRVTVVKHRAPTW